MTFQAYDIYMSYGYSIGEWEKKFISECKVLSDAAALKTHGFCLGRPVTYL